MKPLLPLVLVLSLLLSSRDQTVEAGHTTDIVHVLFTADARRLLSYAAGDGWLILWNVEDGRVLWQSKTDAIQKAYEHYALTAFAFSREDDRIVSGSHNGTVQLWDARTGRLQWQVSAHRETLSRVAFSPDGRLVAAAGKARDHTEIAVLRASDGEVVHRVNNGICTAVGLAFGEGAGTLRAGNAGGSVVEWDLDRGEQRLIGPQSPCRLGHLGQLETFFTPDLSTAVVGTRDFGSGKRAAEVRDSHTGAAKARHDITQNIYDLHARLDATGQTLVATRLSEFLYVGLSTGANRTIRASSGLPSAMDLSLDGQLLVEGGGYGNAAVTITDTRSGRSRRFTGRGQRVVVPPPTELELHLATARADRRRMLDDAKARRKRQAAIDLPSLSAAVSITFEHVGDMVSPWDARIGEMGEPVKSTVKRPAAEATAGWLRLTNASPLPIRIPTWSMYANVFLPGHPCAYEYADGAKLPGVCEGHEVNLRFDLQDKRGKSLDFGPHGGSHAVLLPGTSALFAVPLAVFKDDRTLTFAYSFLRETEEGEIDTYGEPTTLKIRLADLRTGR